MRIEDLKIGMSIRICRDPFFSIIEYGALSGYKRKLAGTVQTIKNIVLKSNRIYIKPPKGCGHNEISFNIKDLRRIESSLITIEPELFNPEQLVVK